jgi:hypothetical protein
MISRLGCRKAARRMVRTGLRKLTKIATLCAVFGMLLAAPAAAQIFGRTGGPANADGEPTDPDSAFPVYPGADVSATDYGLTGTSPQVQTQSEAQSWFDALLQFLRSLLPAKGANG